MRLDPIRTGLFALAVAAFGALGATVAASKTATTVSPGQTAAGRYQLSRPEDADHHGDGANWMVLLDTATGDAWLLERGFVNGHPVTAWVALPPRPPVPAQQ